MPDLSALTSVTRAVYASSSRAADTVTTFGGDPKLATSDPSNTTGLVIVILLTLLILVGGALLYLRYRHTGNQAHTAQGSGTASDG